MKKYISILLAAVLVLACLSACGTSDKPADADNSEKLSVVTTIFPQYDFTRQIVGDKADVTMLLKPGAESHSYEPTPQDIKTIQNCDLFIYTGGENDVWVDDILNSMGDQRPDTLRLIDCVPTVNEEIVEGMEHEHDHDHVYLHAHGIPHSHGHVHENQKAVINRLSRAIGHLEKVKRMVEEGYDCSEVLVQLAAVRSALDNTGKVILKDHMRHCMVDAVAAGDQEAIDDLCVAIDKFMK